MNSLFICCRETGRRNVSRRRRDGLCGDQIMDNLGGVVTILAVCLIVLAIGAMGRKVEWLVNFVLRAVMGTVGIYAINYMLAARQLQVAVGINPFTVLTSGILGFPGVAVLYGIHFFKIL